MIVIGLADVHGNTGPIKKMRKIMESADVILLVGDITNFGKRADIKRVITSCNHNKRRLFAVSGNCDYREVDNYLNEKDINLHGKGEVYKGIGFTGLGGSLITPFGTPNELTEKEIQHCLAKGGLIPPNTPMVLVSHQPPAHTNCDRIASGKHVGSVAVREFIEKRQPRICFTGHIHESVGVDMIGDTHIINPGMLSRGRYAHAEINDDVATIEVREIP